MGLHSWSRTDRIVDFDSLISQQIELVQLLSVRFSGFCEHLPPNQIREEFSLLRREVGYLTRLMDACLAQDGSVDEPATR